MGRVIQFLKGNISIKASIAKDKTGRKGYFIAESDLADANGKIIVKNISGKATDKKKSVAKEPASVKKETPVRSEVEELLKEMKDYKNGKLKLRSVDDFLRTV